MVLQYKAKTSSKWKDYPGKDKKNKKVFHLSKSRKFEDKLKDSVAKYDFRLLNHDKSKVLVEKGTYSKVLKRMRQIEFFKHH